MHPAQLNKLLFKVGLRFDAKDLVTAFSLFDRRQNGVVSLEEFCEVLNLTDYEIDLAIEKIRVHLLKGCSSPNDASASGAGKPPSRQGAVVPPAGRPNAGVLGSSIITSKSQIGKNIIRENFTLVQVFNMVNTKDDGIFSLDEMMDLSTKVEVFLTEEEARKCLSKMDLDGDDRVEEADFITFMRNDSNATVNKAFRVRECASTLRRWLVRGTTENASANSTASASAQQWKAFKKQYEKHTKRAFPNYLDAQIMLITMSNQGTRLSALEARELTLLVAPEKNGRIHQADLHSFMGREHRSYGELIALMERELMKDIIDAYRAHDAANTAHGAEDADLAEMFRRKIGEVKKAVEKVYLQPPPGAETDPTRAPREGEGEGEEEVYTSTNNVAAQEYGHRLKRTNMEVISIVQLKDGLEFFFK
jgi:Ca2+-binding EF-hand superfamily protein